MILGSENRSQTVSRLASQSHMFYISGGKSIDKNISLSYWLVTDYCFLVQFSSVAQSCLTLCNPMNRSTPGFPVHHQLQEFTQTHVHRVSDAIQPSHHLSSPSPPAPNPSQHQSLFQWVNSSHEMAKVLEFQPQHHHFMANRWGNIGNRILNTLNSLSDKLPVSSSFIWSFGFLLCFSICNIFLCHFILSILLLLWSPFHRWQGVFSVCFCCQSPGRWDWSRGLCKLPGRKA